MSFERRRDLIVVPSAETSGSTITARSAHGTQRPRHARRLGGGAYRMSTPMMLQMIMGKPWLVISNGSGEGGRGGEGGGGGLEVPGGSGEGGGVR